MKKTLMLSFALFLASAVLAQTKTSTKTGTATKAPVGGTTRAVTATPADCYINKTWKLTQVERFGVTKSPNDAQKNDMIMLSNDGTFKMVIDGVEKTGTWTRGSWMSLKPADGGPLMPVKIESCEGTTFKIDYRDEDVHNHFTYSL